MADVIDAFERLVATEAVDFSTSRCGMFKDAIDAQFTPRPLLELFAAIERRSTNHDFPLLVQADPAAATRDLPVAWEDFLTVGLGPAFVDYMASWKGFVGS